MTAAVTAADILALDFDGVLCDGIHEYFEASRRTCVRVWPNERVPDANLFPAFRTLRPVIMSGWEMPILLRAIERGSSQSAISRDWDEVRDGLVRSEALPGADLVRTLQRTLDDVRREWIAADRDDWLSQNVPYCRLDEIRRVVGEPERALVVTTKEGEFARLILDSWNVRLAGIHGKEAGIHKCDNLKALIADFTTARGRRPTLWFVEDRLGDAPARHHASRSRGCTAVPGGVGLQHADDAGRGERKRSRARARARPVSAGHVELALSRI